MKKSTKTGRNYQLSKLNELLLQLEAATADVVVFGFGVQYCFYRDVFKRNKERVSPNDVTTFYL